MNEEKGNYNILNTSENFIKNCLKIHKKIEIIGYSE